MPVTNYLTSVHQLPEKVSLQQSVTGCWELRVKGVLLGQFASQENGLNYFCENANVWERKFGLDLTPTVIEEAQIIPEPKTFIQKLLGFLAK